MTSEWNAYVRVVPRTGNADQAAAMLPRQLTDDIIKAVADVINRSTQKLRAEIQLDPPSPAGNELGISDVQIEFGVDIEAETGIPIIGPLTGTRASAGATFKVSVTLSR